MNLQRFPSHNGDNVFHHYAQNFSSHFFLFFLWPEHGLFSMPKKLEPWQWLPVSPCSPFLFLESLNRKLKICFFFYLGLYQILRQGFYLPIFCVTLKKKNSTRFIFSILSVNHYEFSPLFQNSVIWSRIRNSLSLLLSISLPLRIIYPVPIYSCCWPNIVLY